VGPCARFPNADGELGDAEAAAEAGDSSVEVEAEVDMARHTC